MQTTSQLNPGNRREFLGIAAVAALASSVTTKRLYAADDKAADDKPNRVIRPPEGKTIWLSCKLGMIAKKLGDRALSLTERLHMAKEAGFDGVDFDQAGEFSEQQARQAVYDTGLFVHNAINHAHWSKRLTSKSEEERAAGAANIAHCIRVSHAAGGNGVLIVVGHGDDGPAEEIEERCRREIKKLLPLAASLGQPILFENVWNKMMYDHDSPPEQSAERFVKFVDSFRSPWVGMYYDIGNHWKYGQPTEWIHAFGHRCVKLDIKGFSRKENKFTEITAGDLPWDQVRKALADIGFTGWATAEVGGGDLARLKIVRQQMEQALYG